MIVDAVLRSSIQGADFMKVAKVHEVGAGRMSDVLGDDKVSVEIQT